MRETGCLLPPRQRSTARFMNLPHTVKRSRNMQQIFASLNANKRQTLDFVNAHGKTTGESGGVFGFVNGVLKRVKPEGLSKKNIDACLKETDRMLNNRNKRTVRFKSSVRGQLERERDKPAGEKSAWNASGDMTESLWGCCRFKRPGNPLHGVTACALILPLLTRTGDKDRPSAVESRRFHEGIFMKDLESRTKGSLTDNPAVKRMNTLAG
ncbi:hypothetical protein Barb4_02370 [Bacteroidales bacterium Barb4]|nr:hypothetical protein Barb4_02370 [Bacteroidales bacterium Barb4]